MDGPGAGGGNASDGFSAFLASGHVIFGPGSAPARFHPVPSFPVRWPHHAAVARPPQATTPHSPKLGRSPAPRRRTPYPRPAQAVKSPASGPPGLSTHASRDAAPCSCWPCSRRVRAAAGLTPRWPGIGGRRWPGLVTEQFTGLASQRLAEPGQGAEPDCPRPAVLEDGQVDDRDVHPGRQFGEGHSALAEQFVKVQPDRGCLVPAGRSVAVAVLGIGSPPGHTVPLISSSMAAPSRVIRAKVSSAAPARAETGSRGWNGTLSSKL